MEMKPITVVEVAPFPAQADKAWSQTERDAFINYIAHHPLEGDEIPGTGGLRKLRWGRQGVGKRGGVRVIYYFYNETAPIFLLHLYSKNERVDIKPEIKKELVEFTKLVKAKLKGK
ncbi:MAG: type II toxin-antitoxin system RelE/ParE family toxin [Deltaproteobacteria bacterium]|nr:type II toxin-antitoxin system RelE/ParE family toxin [Deltaproteobacteria bacterium]